MLTHPHTSESFRIESRARAWQEAQKALVGSAPGPMRSVNYPSTSSTDPRAMRSAATSIYYDPVINPTGAPPSCKPPAFRHPDGVIRTYPPEHSDDSPSSSSDSDSCSYESEISDTPEAQTGAHQTVVEPIHRPPPPPPPRPVSRPPPPRPVGSSGGRPALPMSGLGRPDLASPATPITQASIPTDHHRPPQAHQHPLSAPLTGSAVALPRPAPVYLPSASEPTDHSVVIESAPVRIGAQPLIPTPQSVPTQSRPMFMPSTLRRKPT